MADAWVEHVRAHPLWERAPADPQALAVRAQTVTLVAALAATRRDGEFLVADDPWQDPDLAIRFADRTARLAAALPEAALSAAEVGLLLALPFLYDTLWSTLAGRERAVGPHDLTPSADASSDRAAFERFAQTYSQPYRRALAALGRPGRTRPARSAGGCCTAGSAGNRGPTSRSGSPTR